MSITFQNPSQFAPLPITADPARSVRAAFTAAVEMVRSAIQRALTSSYAERNAKDVDILSTSSWSGYGRNGVTWDGIGYRI